MSETDLPVAGVLKFVSAAVLRLLGAGPTGVKQ